MAVGAESAVGARAEEVVLHLLVQLVVILAVTRAVVWAAKSLRQTDVAGEILAGILLGPSAFGALAPSAMRRIFDPSTSTIFIGLAQVGLVLLMFQIGLEFELKSHLRASKRAIAVVSLAGMILPFVAGIVSAAWFHARLPEPRPPLLGFRLFFGIAMSITAIPILGRIFMELGLSHTRTAALAIGAAAIDDVAGWLLLGGVTLLVEQQFSATRFVLRVVALAAYALATFYVVRPLLKRALGAHLRRFGSLQPSAIGGVLLVVLASGAITSYLGVFAIIGGFLMGAALHDDRRFVEEWKASVAPLVGTLFLPIFFVYTGLRTDIGSLRGASEWGMCLLVVAIAFVSKFGGAYLGARAVGERPRTAAAIGVCMNTRALMELVVINIGYDLGVLPRTTFTMLVIMAIASTFLATPLIRALMGADQRGVGEIVAIPGGMARARRSAETVL